MASVVWYFAVTMSLPVCGKFVEACLTFCYKPCGFGTSHVAFLGITPTPQSHGARASIQEFQMQCRVAALRSQPSGIHFTTGPAAACSRIGIDPGGEASVGLEEELLIIENSLDVFDRDIGEV